MFIAYYYKAGATQANIAADVAKLVSNTPISELSADCDKVQTTIIANSIPSNWEYFDQVGTKAIVRSLNADGVSYKYAGIKPGVAVDSAAGYYGIGLSIYESWNASTHLGLNQGIHYNRKASELATAKSANVIGSIAGAIYLYATSRLLAVDFNCVAEFTRDSLAIDSSYPCHVAFPLASRVWLWGSLGGTSANTYNSYNIALCRYSAITGDVSATGVDLTCFLARVEPARSYLGLTTQTYRTPEEIEFLNGCPLYAQAALEFSGAKTTLGKIYDIVFTTTAGLSINHFDEITIEGETYMCLGLIGNGTLSPLWVKKG